MQRLTYLLLSAICSLWFVSLHSRAEQSEQNSPDSQRLNRELKVIQTPYLNPDEVRFYSNLIWQRQPGNGLSVKLLPNVNASERDSYETTLTRENIDDLENRTVPSALYTVNQQLVNQTSFLQTTQHTAEFQLQFIIQDYETLYNLTGSDNWLDYSFARMDQAWSSIAGDNKPSRVKITAILYDSQGNMLLQMPMAGSLSPCEKSANPMVFPAQPGQAFLNGFAKTTTGQTYIAVVNRTLTEVAKYLANEPIRGEVLRVEQNNIYLNLGQGIVYPEETVELIYNEKQGLPNYSVGRLEIETVNGHVSVAHAIDMHTAHVLAGDKVKLKKVIQERAYLSAGQRQVTCS